MSRSCSENIQTFVSPESSVRLQHNFHLSLNLNHESYSHARLLEINSYSLFPSGFLDLASPFFIALPNLLKKRIVLWWFYLVFVFLSKDIYIITQTMNDEIDDVELLSTCSGLRDGRNTPFGRSTGMLSQPFFSSCIQLCKVIYALSTQLDKLKQQKNV